MTDLMQLLWQNGTDLLVQAAEYEQDLTFCNQKDMNCLCLRPIIGLGWLNDRHIIKVHVNSLREERFVVNIVFM